MGKSIPEQGQQWEALLIQGPEQGQSHQGEAPRSGGREVMGRVGPYGASVPTLGETCAPGAVEQRSLGIRLCSFTGASAALQTRQGGGGRKLPSPGRPRPSTLHASLPVPWQPVPQAGV